MVVSERGETQHLSRRETSEKLFLCSFVVLFTSSRLSLFLVKVQDQSREEK